MQRNRDNSEADPFPGCTNVPVDETEPQFGLLNRYLGRVVTAGATNEMTWDRLVGHANLLLACDATYEYCVGCVSYQIEEEKREVPFIPYELSVYERGECGVLRFLGWSSDPTARPIHVDFVLVCATTESATKNAMMIADLRGWQQAQVDEADDALHTVVCISGQQIARQTLDSDMSE